MARVSAFRCLRTTTSIHGMGEKLSKNKKIWLGAVAVLAISVIASVVSGGSGYWIIGVAGALGAWLGVSAGNKKAREVDEYREQWLNKRKRKLDNPDVPDSRDA